VTYDATLARRATGLLREFNAAGVLTAADVHVAQRLGQHGVEDDEQVLLAVALTVRGTRHGSVVLDLATAAGTITVEGREFENEDQFDLGTVPFTEAFAQSCNTTFIQAGLELPDPALADRLITAAQRVPGGQRCDLRRMGREMGVALANRSSPTFIWGVDLSGDALYASDMLGGVFKLRALTR